MNTESASKPRPLWLAWPEEGADVSLGKKLKQLRKEKGWSQDEFAHHAQIDGRQVSRYENERVMPSIDVVIKMAKAYNVSIDYLLLDNMPRRSLDVHATKPSQRVMTLGQLSEDDERSLLHLFDAIEAKNKLKELAAGIS